MAIPSSLLRNLNIEAQMGRGAGDSLRSKKMSEIMRSMPRQAARIGTMAPIQERPDTSLQQGLGDLAKSIKAASDMKKERAATAAFEQLYNQPMVVDSAMQNMSGPDMMEMPMVKPQPSGMDVMSLAMQFPGTKASANAMKMGQLMNAQEQNRLNNEFRDKQLAQRKAIADAKTQFDARKRKRLMTPDEMKASGKGPEYTGYIDGFGNMTFSYQPSMEQRKAASSAGAPRITVGEKQNLNFQKILDTKQVDIYQETMTQGLAAQRSIQTNLEPAIILNKEDATGDKLTSNLKLMAGNALQWLGFDVSSSGFKSMLGSITNTQTFQALIKDQLLNKMMQQKGPQTKEDQKIMLDTLAKLGNTQGARDFLLRSARAIARRDIDLANHYETWLETNPNLNGANKAYFDAQKGMSLFKKHPKTKNFIFYNEFVDRYEKTRPDMTSKQINQLWRDSFNSRVANDEV